ncbi:hypothetical protein ACWGKU_37275 [Kitasatospora sp. NPDC054768]
MDKRVPALLTVCALGALALTSCGSDGSGGGTDADGKVTLKLVVADYGDKESS